MMICEKCGRPIELYDNEIEGMHYRCYQEKIREQKKTKNEILEEKTQVKFTGKELDEEQPIFINGVDYGSKNASNIEKDFEHYKENFVDGFVGMDFEQDYTVTSEDPVKEVIDRGVIAIESLDKILLNILPNPLTREHLIKYYLETMIQYHLLYNKSYMLNTFAIETLFMEREKYIYDLEVSILGLKRLLELLFYRQVEFPLKPNDDEKIIENVFTRLEEIGLKHTQEISEYIELWENDIRWKLTKMNAYKLEYLEFVDLLQPYELWVFVKKSIFDVSKQFERYIASLRENNEN